MLEEFKELIKNNNFKELRNLIKNTNEHDLAEIMSDLSVENVAKIFRIIPKDKAVLVFQEFDPIIATELLKFLSDKEAVNLLSEMSADDAVDILEEMPANIVDKILRMCSKEVRKDLNKLLNYEEDSAGSIMTVEYVELKENLRVSEAINVLKYKFEEYETINTCYVLDKHRKIVGTISISDLLFSSKNKMVKTICNKEFISVKTSDDQELVASIFKKYDKNIIPVVDSEERMVGIITIDDIVDVLEEEATEDMKKMAAIVPVDKPYSKVGVFETFKARIPWLLLLMVSATFTGKIIESFEQQLAAYTVLTAFIPMLMDTGGNAGGQSSVSIIRALSLRDIEFKDIFKVVFKEFRIALLCSLVLAICNFLKMLLLDRVELLVAATVCLTLCSTIILAKTIGCMLPMLAKRLGFDPAVMASPFITTIVDACSLLIYFKIATVILGL